MKKYIIKIFPIIISFAFLLTAIFFIMVKPQLNTNCGNSSIMQKNSTLGGHFKLKNTDGIIVNSRNFLKAPALIYFGYSYCPDVCPFDLQRNTIAIDILLEEDVEVLPIFITIDPERDTPERLNEFSNFVHPKLLAFTGSQEEIRATMNLFKVYGKKSNDTGLEDDNYLMDHSAFTYLVDSNGLFLDYFSRKVSAEEMAKRVSCHIKS